MQFTNSDEPPMVHILLYIILVEFYPFFLPNFVVSNCCSSYYLVSLLQLPYGLERDEGWKSCVLRYTTQPAILLLNTAHIQPGSQPHQCVGGYTEHLATLVSAHCARPATGVAGAWWDKDIPTDQALPNPDDARPIVHDGTAGAVVQRP
jgi:hypothetical protein